MPRQVLFVNSPLARAAVVAVLMWGLLAGSLVVAWAVTGAPLLPPGLAPRVTHTLGGATLALPERWALEGERAAGPGVPALKEFVNRTSPGERLRAAYFTTSEPADAEQLLGRLVLPQLVAGRVLLVSPGDPPWRRVASDDPTGRTLELVFSTRRAAAVATAPQLHAVRLVSPDRRRFWVYQLTEQVARERWSRDREVVQMRRLRDLLADVAYPDAG
ncbi:MAG: hypothetical protein AAF710_06035 [Planctomycetota bacterium]